MNYYFVKKRFFQKAPINEKIFLQYLAQKRAWQTLKTTGFDVKEALEQEKLIQNFNEKQWIILKKTDENQQQEGPYSSREIFDFLQLSQVVTTDLIWKKGFPQWMEISATDVFRGLFHIEENIHHSETADILQSIVEMVRPEKLRAEMRRVDTSPDEDDTVFLIHD